MICLIFNLSSQQLIKRLTVFNSQPQPLTQPQPLSQPVMASVADKDWESKCTLICKPEQSGKTFVMIQQIIRDLEEPTEGKKIVNIILCDNNLLLTKQTGERVKNDLSEFSVDGDLYLELSSSKRTTYHTAD